MKKHFILSTRTMVSKRNVTLNFGSDNDIYIPMAVVDEMQTRYAKENTERGRIARENLEYLWSLDFKKLRKGVKQTNGSTIYISTNHTDIELPKDVEATTLDRLDRRILQTCIAIKNEINNNTQINGRESEPVILISKSVPLRMKAEMCGIEAQSFKDELLPELSEQYTGRIKLKVSEENYKLFCSQGKIAISLVIPKEDPPELYENMFVEIEGGYKKANGRIENGYIVPLTFEKTHPYGITAKNNAQKFMIEALTMDEKRATLVIFKGPAGTAKTFLSLAVGLQKVVEEGLFPGKILISRSPTETGEKLGFLPGNELEKIHPYLRGIKDNLGNLINPKKDEIGQDIEYPRNKRGNKICPEKPSQEDGSYVFASGAIRAEAIGYIRGRSICDTFIIIDEAQNLTATEIKTIITRVGTGTKLVIIGDPEQIDRPELSERENGLSYASERFKGEPRCWQITLTDDESVRSELAKIASRIL